MGGPEGTPGNALPEPREREVPFLALSTVSAAMWLEGCVILGGGGAMVFVSQLGLI